MCPIRAMPLCFSALIEDRDKSGCCLRRAEVRLAAALSNNRLFQINLRLQIVPICRQRTLGSNHSRKAKGLVQICLRSEPQQQTCRRNPENSPKLAKKPGNLTA